METDKPFVLFHRGDEGDLRLLGTAPPDAYVTIKAIEGSDPPDWVTAFPVLFDLTTQTAFCGRVAVARRCSQLENDGLSPEPLADPDVNKGKRGGKRRGRR